MTDRLQHAIALIKAGDKVNGQRLLANILMEDPANGDAWLWMAGLVSPDKQRYCLEKVLALNPNNLPARQLLNQLNVPSVTESPASGIAFAAPEKASDAPDVETNSSEFISAPHQPVWLNKVYLTAVGFSLFVGCAAFSFFTWLFGRNAPSQAWLAGGVLGMLALLISLIVAGGIAWGINAGWSAKENAKQIQTTARTSGQQRQKARQRFRSRMLWGGGLALAGLLVTGASLLLAVESGGYYVICTGAIITGLVGFVRGLFGWLATLDSADKTEMPTNPITPGAEAERVSTANPKRIVLAVIFFLLWMVAGVTLWRQSHQPANILESSLINGEVCEAPCWSGVTPGSTTRAQVLATLSKYPEQARDCKGSEYYSEVVECKGAYIESDASDTVKIIWLDTNDSISLAPIIDRLGQPDFVAATLYIQPNDVTEIINIIYAHRGVILHVAWGSTDDFNLAENTQIFGATFFDPRSTDKPYQAVDPFVGTPVPLQKWQGYGVYRCAGNNCP